MTQVANLFKHSILQNKSFQEHYSSVHNFFLEKPIKFPLYGIQKQIMVFYLSLVRFYKIDLIIESGVGMGFSTEYLINFSKEFGVETISIDLNINQIYVNHRQNLSFENSKSSFVEGDGFIKILKIVKQVKNLHKNIALFLDGPKNLEAICLHHLCCLINPKINFTFLDDVIPNSVVHKSLEKNSYFYIYDLINKNKLFRIDKKEVLKSYLKLQLKKHKTEAELNSQIKIANLFKKREVIIFNYKKRYFHLFFLWFNPLFFYFLVKLKFSTKKILFFLIIFRKINYLLEKK
jgi:hypothetical protein